MKKTPKSKFLPEQEKIPRKAGFDENPNQLKPAWRIGRLEFCDPYGWHTLDAGKFQEVLSKLASFESMFLKDIIGANSHPVKVDILSKEAKDRLDALHLDDIEELLSLRLNGANRVWGIQEHNIVILLWWDPEHKVCPSLLKNT